MVTLEQRLQSLETWADNVTAAIRKLHEDNQSAQRAILDLIGEVTRLLQSHSVDLASMGTRTPLKHITPFGLT